MTPDPTQAFLRYSILAYLLDKEPADSTIGDMFHQIAQEAGTLTSCKRLWGYFSTVLRQWLWFVLLWCGGIIGMLLLTYSIRFLVRIE